MTLFQDIRSIFIFRLFLLFSLLILNSRIEKAWFSVLWLSLISLSQAVELDGAIVKDLIARRLVILDNIRENDEAGINYQKV